jgi:hypothetical protein
MQLFPRTRRFRRVLVPAVVMAAAGLVAGTATPVHAFPADPAAATAITNELNRIRARIPTLAAANFQTDLSGGAQITPDGIGGFQFFQGTVDIGAIYTDKKCLDNRDREVYCHGVAVYGDILASWAARGYETNMGYPQTMEGTITTYCRQKGDREQEFKNWQTYAINIACWNPSTGTRWYRVKGT